MSVGSFAQTAQPWAVISCTCRPSTSSFSCCPRLLHVFTFLVVADMMTAVTKVSPATRNSFSARLGSSRPLSGPSCLPLPACSTVMFRRIHASSRIRIPSLPAPSECSAPCNRGLSTVHTNTKLGIRPRALPDRQSVTSRVKPPAILPALKVPRYVQTAEVILPGCKYTH